MAKTGSRLVTTYEAGHDMGRIVNVHIHYTGYKDHTRRASSDVSQYEIEGGTTNHVAMHKGRALSKAE